MKFLCGVYDKVEDIIDIEIIFMLLKNIILKKRSIGEKCFKIFLKIWVNVWREKK